MPDDLLVTEGAGPKKYAAKERPGQIFETRVIAGGETVQVSTEFERPNDVVAYTAEDVVGPTPAAVLTFAGAARLVGGSGYIVGARLMTDQAANTERFRLHLYDTAPAAIADNAAFTGPLYADRATYIGYVDFPALTAEGAGATAAHGQNSDIRLAFVAPAAATSIFGVLETLTAWTPAALQDFFVELTIEQN